MKKLFALFIAAALLLGLGACNSGQGKPQDPISSNASTPEQTTSPPDVNTIEWPEISSEGVDEDAFLSGLDFKLLEEVAAELQVLCEEIAQKQRDDLAYALSAEWWDDVNESARFCKVVNMGSSAMKPLYWIIYKSSQQGLYEYTCALALQEISGCDFADDDGQGWATSKGFLELFTQKILSEQAE
jgi:hypothetical protein